MYQQTEVPQFSNTWPYASNPQPQYTTAWNVVQPIQPMQQIVQPMIVNVPQVQQPQ